MPCLAAFSHLISLHGSLSFILSEEFAAVVAVEGINVLREPASDGKVSSFEC